MPGTFDDSDEAMFTVPDFSALAQSLQGTLPPTFQPPQEAPAFLPTSPQPVGDEKFSFKQNDLLCSLYYLSHTETKQEDAELLRKSMDYFQGFDRELFISYLQNYQASGMFPEFFHFVASSQILKSGFNPELFVVQSLPRFREVFKAYLAKSEMYFVEAMLPAESDSVKKMEYVKRLQVLMQGEVKQDTKKILSASNIDIIKSTTARCLDGAINFPLAHMNELCSSMGPGTTITIMGGPASGKTTLALNIAFLNSVIADKNTLYFYLEDMPERYQYNIFSRFSYHVGDKIPSVSLKRGVDMGDEEALKKIREVQNRFLEEKKGEIYYVSMNDLSNEPDLFARKMAALINELNIDIIITDYIQKTKSFRPKHYSDMEYMNQIASILSLLALGQFNNKPCLNIMLSQLKREAEERVLKNRGKMTLFDGAEVHSIERDSFVVLGVFSDQPMRDAGEASVQLLKNRDEAADSNPEITFFDPAYCYIGDVRGLESVYSNEAMEAAWEQGFSDL